MKFGIGLMIPVARPWNEGSEEAAYKDALSIVKAGDRLGFDQVWFVEHHFLEEYSHCSAPDIFLATCAANTSQIRLGRGIALCLPQYNHPAVLAERCAVLDIVSGGRLEFGTGRAGTLAEISAFGVDPDRTKASWDEFVREIPKMWMSERYSYNGEFFSMPERNVLPKPLQKPHPPMWVAVSSDRTELDAADRGLGWHGLAQGGAAEMEARIKEYRRRIQSCEPVGAFVNEQVNFSNFLYCHEDAGVADRVGRQLVYGFLSSSSLNTSEKDAVATPSYRTGGLLSSLRENATRQLATPSEKGGGDFGIGTPAAIISAVKRWESIGADRINFQVTSAGFIDFVGVDRIIQSMELFAAEVMPAFGLGNAA